MGDIYIYIYIYNIITCGPFSFTARLYRPSLTAGPPGYILFRYSAVVDRF